MDYRKRVPDFIERTWSNLETIEQLAKQQGKKKKNVYKITQLINSCLGLVVFPKEDREIKELLKFLPNNLRKKNDNLKIDLEKIFKKLAEENHEVKYSEIFKKSLKDLEKENWRLPKVYFKCDNLKELLRRLRNAIAHSGVFTIPNKNGEIEKIIFIDINKNKVKRYLNNKINPEEISDCFKIIEFDIDTLRSFLENFKELVLRNLKS
ncbi:MAG: hypothetical protein PWQ59_228 [Thermoanaerobacterium sp.]|jgi:hypothetical protein|nr:hypothetical protein [Thermoanaerobacterium sp.]MDK2811800.1 hypothetical protein [Petrotoga sp.]